MDKELEIVTNEGLEVADEVTTTAAKTTSQLGPIMLGVGGGLLGGALICWGISKIRAYYKAKKQQAAQPVQKPVKDEPTEKSE